MEEEKPFGVVWIVLLLLIAVLNDGAEILFDLLAATGVGLTGEVIMEPINLALDALFTSIFFIKCGFGGPSIMQLVDDVLEVIGIPGRTICVALGIVIANNPKGAKIAKLAASVETGGAGEIAEAGEAAEGAQALSNAGEALSTESGVVAETGAIESEEVSEIGGSGAQTIEEKTSTETSRETPREIEEKRTTEELEGAPDQENTGKGSENAEEDQKREDLEKEMQTEAERSPDEVAQEELFENTPEPKDEEEEEETSDSPSAIKETPPPQDEELAQAQKASRVKQEQTALKKPGRVVDIERKDDLPKAA